MIPYPCFDGGEDVSPDPLIVQLMPQARPFPVRAQPARAFRELPAGFRSGDGIVAAVPDQHGGR